jgi:deazaflavin-dependent oxidoreductase (nitroreductase family)
VSFTDRYKRWFTRAAAGRIPRHWLGPRVITRLDRFFYRSTGGWLLSLGSRAFPTLLLTTVGHKTGRDHSVPLLYLELSEGWAVVASNYGRPEHPTWSTNLLANPRGSIEIGSQKDDVRARLLSENEKQQIWPRLLELFEGWQRYEAETHRSIRVFVLEPV